MNPPITHRAIRSSAPLIACLLTAVALSGCAEITGAKVPQSNICVAVDDAQAIACEPGQLFYFQPLQWGNEQLPMNVAAVYCDTNHAITQNSAGVICVFTDKRLRLLQGQ